jgi:Lon protease-like protein
MNNIPIPHVIPVLPLPHLVFFPGTRLALHIPRSFADRMRGNPQPRDFFLGIVLRKGQCFEDEDVFPIGCVGKVIRAQPLPCGESVHLDLHGFKRFELKEGWFENGFGRAWIETLQDWPGTLSTQRRKKLMEQVEFFSQRKQLAPGLLGHLKSELNDEAFLNLICLESHLSPTEKYFLLEVEDLEHRAGRLLDLLWFKQEALQANRGICKKDSC